MPLNPLYHKFETFLIMIIDLIGTWAIGVPVVLLTAFVFKLSVVPVCRAPAIHEYSVISSYRTKNYRFINSELSQIDI